MQTVKATISRNGEVVLRDVMLTFHTTDTGIFEGPPGSVESGDHLGIELADGRSGKIWVSGLGHTPDSNPAMTFTVDGVLVQ